MLEKESKKCIRIGRSNSLLWLLVVVKKKDPIGGNLFRGKIECIGRYMDPVCLMRMSFAIHTSDTVHLDTVHPRRLVCLVLAEGHLELVALVALELDLQQKRVRDLALESALAHQRPDRMLLCPLVLKRHLGQVC